MTTATTGGGLRAASRPSCSWCGAPAETAIAVDPTRLRLLHTATPACAACGARVLTPAVTPPEPPPEHADQITIGDLLTGWRERRDYSSRAERP